MPTFSAPPDCTPWVIGGLWPAELSPGNAETATLAQYLKVDLQRIARSANDDLRAVGRAGLEYVARRDAETQVIEEARDRAVRRVESTMRQLRQLGQNPLPGAGPPRSGVDGPGDRDSTQVPLATQEVAPPIDMDTTRVIPAVKDGHPQTTLVADLGDHTSNSSPMP